MGLQPRFPPMNLRQWVWRVAMVVWIAGGRECLAQDQITSAAGGEYSVVARTASSRVWRQAVSWTNDWGWVNGTTNEFAEFLDQGRLTLRMWADCAGLPSALAVKRYERPLQTDRREAQRAQDCSRLLAPRQTWRQMLNV